METLNIDHQAEESLIIVDNSYIPPSIEIIEVFAEKGFAGSNYVQDFGDGIL